MISHCGVAECVEDCTNLYKNAMHIYQHQRSSCRLIIKMMVKILEGWSGYKT
jgi:hypothetical protein